jgi:hypothetical protein
LDLNMTTEHFIAGKDASLESSIGRMQEKLLTIGFHVVERSWLNPVDGIWSVHVSDRDCPLLFTNGKGGSKLAAAESALGEFFERLSCNYFWTHSYPGDEFAASGFTHYPQERWFQFDDNDGEWPEKLLTAELQAFYNLENNVTSSMLVERNCDNGERGICALLFTRLSDDACEDLPDMLNESGLDDQRLVGALIGLSADAGSFWEDLRLGELRICSRWPSTTKKRRAKAATGHPFWPDQRAAPPCLPLYRKPAQALRFRRVRAIRQRAGKSLRSKHPGADRGLAEPSAAVFRHRAAGQGIERIRDASSPAGRLRQGALPPRDRTLR